jgi:hypothetical protein
VPDRDNATSDIGPVRTNTFFHETPSAPPAQVAEGSRFREVCRPLCKSGLTSHHLRINQCEKRLWWLHRHDPVQLLCRHGQSSNRSRLIQWRDHQGSQDLAGMPPLQRLSANAFVIAALQSAQHGQGTAPSVPGLVDTPPLAPDAVHSAHQAGVIHEYVARTPRRHRR